MSEIRITVENDICSITLHNPERRNAISQNMWLQIREFARCKLATSARVIVLKGHGSDAFSAGADVSEFRRDRSDPSTCSEYDDLVEYTCQAFERIPRPTIALIKGACLGAGASLAASCDLRVASDDSYFAVPAAKLGLGYDPRGIDRFSRVFGEPFTRLALFSARKIPATIAHQWGGVHILAPIATFDDAANQMIQAIRNNAPLTLEAAKFAIRSLGATDGDTELEVRRLYMRADQSRDYQEGLSAFAEKRSPSFRGE